ncbi:MAG: hypothetical protein ACU843_12430 [Gammaproteobacteria bacterium]
MLIRVLRSIQRFFFAPGEIASSGDLPCHIDLDEMIKSLKLDREARIQAQRELPATRATHPDGAERKIHALIQKRMADLTRVANQKLIGYNTTLLHTDLNNEQQRIQNLAEHAKLKLNSLLAEAEQRLRTLKDEIERNTAYYRSFQQNHRRDHDAEYPESVLYHYSLVFLILVAEALANGYFFARGSEFGMLGGISQALIVAVLNIVPAFLFAGMFCLRYTNHVAFLKRAAAYCGLLLYLGWMGMFNLGIAHYREILSSGETVQVSEILDRLWTLPFVLADLNSWLLLAMGIFFALIAMIDGYKSDDPYPEYGRIQRLNDEIRQGYEDECQELSRQANQIRADFLGELQMLGDSAKSTFTHLCHLAEAKPALVAQHQRGLKTLAQAGDALIHHYRSTNARQRKTPPPAYFSESWRPEIDFELVGAGDERERLEQQRKLFESFPQFLQQRNNELERIYAAFFEHLQQIEPAIQPIARAIESPKA